MLSQQAIILSICNFVILIAVILSLFVIKKSADKKDESKLVTILKNIAALVLFLIIMVLQVYSVNCMVYGECGSWAWILTAFAVFGTLAYLGVFAYVAISAAKLKASVKDLVKPISEADKLPPTDKLEIKLIEKPSPAPPAEATTPTATTPPPPVTSSKST